MVLIYRLPANDSRARLACGASCVARGSAARAAIGYGAELLLKPVFGTLADRLGLRPVLLGRLIAFAAASTNYVFADCAGPSARAFGRRSRSRGPAPFAG
jgi:hypothetical protein